MLYSLPMLCFRCVESNLLHSMTHQSLMLLLKNLKKNLATSRMLSFVCACVCARVCLYCVCTHISVLNISDMRSTQKRSHLLVGRALYNVHLETAYQEQVSVIIKTSFSNNEISHFTGDFDIREVLKSV